VDVETLAEPETPTDSGNQERLALFLERSYVAGVSPEVCDLVNEALVKLVEKKADELGAMLVTNTTYQTASDKSKAEYTLTHLNLFISRSKTGRQYIDSLNGSAQVSDEGSYRSNTFLIRQKDI